MEDFITKASVTQDGEIEVNDISLIVDTDDVKVWHIDLRSKYAGICGYSDDSLHLMAEPDTKHVVEEKRGQSTVIEFRYPNDDLDFYWFVIVDCSRYTARFIAYRQAREPLPERPERHNES